MAASTETVVDEEWIEDEPACEYCGGDGGDPLCDFVLPCPYCGDFG